MDKKNRRKVLVACILAILAVLGVSIGYTTALFSEKGTTNVHIYSGKLDVGFYATKILETKLDDEGFFVDYVERNLAANYPDTLATVDDKSVVDLRLYSLPFNFKNIYPGFKGSVDYLVTNNSKIAVTLNCEDSYTYKFADDTEMTESEALLFGVSTTWTKDTEDITKLADVVVKAGESYSWTVSFDFDTLAGNEYQESKVSIDNIITATQVTRN